MKQIELFETIQRMTPGQALTLSYRDIAEAAEGNIKSLLLDGPARRNDIDQFVKQIRDNWGVNIEWNPIGDKWVVRK